MTPPILLKKTALEPNIENFFNDVLGNHQQKGLIGNAIGSLLKTKNKGFEQYIHRSPFKDLDVLPASPRLRRVRTCVRIKT